MQKMQIKKQLCILHYKIITTEMMKCKAHRIQCNVKGAIQKNAE